jgi:uncharacterized protein YjiS (DUF1127 family)
MQIRVSCSATIFLLHRNISPYLHTTQSAVAGRQKVIIMLAHIVRFLRSWKLYNQSLTELSRLGDRELADIGLTRSDIPRVAWDNANR